MTRSRPSMRYAGSAAATLLLALPACAPPDGDEAAPQDEVGEQSDAGQAPVAADTRLPPVEPIEMAGTAWSANDGDGAVYTTFIDPDGGYRDFRDGQLWQTGSWDQPGSNRLCYRPDNAGEDEDGRRCWTVRPPGEDGVMTAVDEDGREVVVRSVEYTPPEDG